MTKQKILIVEDDADARNLYKKTLTREEYEIVTTESAEEAEEILHDTVFDVILADNVLPGKTGLDVLKNAKKKYPDTIRLLITGFPDLGVLEEAINEAEIFRYLSKPVRTHDLQLTVKTAVEYRKLMEQNKDLLKNLENKVENKTKELSKSEERYRSLFEGADDQIFVLDENFRYTMVNESALKSGGFKLEDAQGKTADELYGLLFERISKKVCKTIEKMLNVNKVYAIGMSRKHRLLGHIVLLTGNESSKLNKEAIETFVYQASAALEKRKVEDLLRESEKRLNDTQRLTKMGGWEYDVEKQTMIWTDETYRIHGLNPGDIEPGATEHIKRSIMCYDEKYRPFIMDTFRKCVSEGKPYDMEFPFTTFQGKRIWIRTMAKAEKEKGKIKRVIGNIMDITERKNAEEALRKNSKLIKQRNKELKNALQELKDAQVQLVHSEKMASIGVLAAGVAHEINNPLSYVISNLTHLRRYSGVFKKFIDEIQELLSSVPELLSEYEEKKSGHKLDYAVEDFVAAVNESIEGADRVKQIVMDLRSFSHRAEDSKSLWNVNEGLEATLNIVWNELKYKAEVIKDYGKVPEIKCNIQQLNQVFVNLLVNAAHAIEKQGIIKVKTYQENKYVCVDVSDTGCGIPEKDIPKIFDAFYSTKSVGKGTGLGLSISQKIIKDHGGTIEVRSEVGKGSTFTIRLPLQ